jgi:hypothetical protein
MSRDFAEMLSALSDAGARFRVVGAHALAAHGVARATGDLDIWIESTPDNARRVWSALVSFGAPLESITPADLELPELVYQIGLAPMRIDLLTSATGLDFATAWQRRGTVTVFGQSVPLIGRDDLIRNKRAVARPRDLADVAELEELERPDGR